ncbi:helix-turn-helix domain-containing protein [Nocardiopsis sp. NPDC058631]|uniref:helix-turn-helix domain-containing protein n=1 Tax=Nocardiopsis sp. NPDC058631 TaxID=3346566 RepID=UPI0036637625
MTPREQVQRERPRLEAAGRFARGEKTEATTRELRVTPGSVRRRWRVWEQGGTDALRSKGPVSAERLRSGQRERLGRELGSGPPARGWSDESQGWTLTRVKLLDPAGGSGRCSSGIWSTAVSCPSAWPWNPARSRHRTPRVQAEQSRTPSPGHAWCIR